MLDEKSWLFGLNFLTVKRQVVCLLFYIRGECMLSIRNMSDLWISLCFGYYFLPCCYFSSCVMHMKKQSPHFLQVWGTDRKMACKSLGRRECNCLLSESQKFWLCAACFPESWMLKFPCCEYGSSSIWLQAWYFHYNKMASVFRVCYLCFYKVQNFNANLTLWT